MAAGLPGRIHVSESTHRLLLHERWEPTGGVEVKGKVREGKVAGGGPRCMPHSQVPYAS